MVAEHSFKPKAASSLLGIPWKAVAIRNSPVKYESDSLIGGIIRNAKTVCFGDQKACMYAH